MQSYCNGSLSNITIDGSAVTGIGLEVGGSLDSAGGSSGVDIHSFTIIKTARNVHCHRNHSKTS